MSSRRVIVAGGGAAGFFGAIACAETAADTEVLLLEKGPQFLSKVRISGGGRCNVTHACFDPRELAARYPRGGKALVSAFHQFQPADTIEWFRSRGVRLKTEADGRLFPVTDSSRTIIDCLLTAAKKAGVKCRLNSGVADVKPKPEGGFEVLLGGQGERLECDRLLLASGGCRTLQASQLASSLGHPVEPPVPSLFTFHLANSWLPALAGVAVEPAEVSVPGTGLNERGAVLVTHWGLSGPAILRLSAWGAREFHSRDYRFPLHVNWVPGYDAEKLSGELGRRRTRDASRRITNSPVADLPMRLWERLVVTAGIPADARWAGLSRAGLHRLAQTLIRSEFQVTGKSLNKEEFVTCGGVALRDVNFRTMESRLCRGLFFAGELLDIDGITGGFNFQAAWTTGWIAGRSAAQP